MVSGFRNIGKAGWSFLSRVKSAIRISNKINTSQFLPSLTCYGNVAKWILYMQECKAIFFFFTLDGKIVHIINTLVMRLALICGICGTF